MTANALAIGGVIGPLGAGYLAEHLGFNGFFYVFAGIAAGGAILFLALMPETSEGRPRGAIESCQIKEG
jgi:MFS family permease